MKKIVSLIAVLGLLSFVGCGGEDNTSGSDGVPAGDNAGGNSNVVGSWISTSRPLEITYASNGRWTFTDTRTGGAYGGGTWTTSGTQRADDYHADTPDTTFSVSGDTLTLNTPDGETETFVRS